MISVVKNRIEMTRGDTAIFAVSLTNPDGTAYELQPRDTLRFTVRKNPASGDKFIEKTGNEIIINPQDTKNMPFGTYFYDLELTKADGTVDTVLPPTQFKICEEVTY